MCAALCTAASSTTSERLTGDACGKRANTGFDARRSDSGYPIAFPKAAGRRNGFCCQRDFGQTKIKLIKVCQRTSRMSVYDMTTGRLFHHGEGVFFS